MYWPFALCVFAPLREKGVSAFPLLILETDQA
jgi:hypothetical protein